MRATPNRKHGFCIAIEEGEAWLLGDVKAIKKAYSRARLNVLDDYENDSICGTWELLADAVYVGGSRRLKDLGWGAVGREKSSWAEKITPYMDVEKKRVAQFPKLPRQDKGGCLSVKERHVIGTGCPA